MSLDRRTVDQHLRRWSAGRCQGMKDVGPNAFGRPAYEAIVERLARTVDGRSVDPATARLQHMHDPADDPAVVDPRLAARIGRKMRLKPRELSSFSQKQSRIMTRPPLETVNHKIAPSETVMGPDSSRDRVDLLGCKLITSS